MTCRERALTEVQRQLAGANSLGMIRIRELEAELSEAQRKLAAAEQEIEQLRLSVKNGKMSRPFGCDRDGNSYDYGMTDKQWEACCQRPDDCIWGGSACHPDAYKRKAAIDAASFTVPPEKGT